jgi:peptidoglycan LD-endopeptidase LytH
VLATAFILGPPGRFFLTAALLVAAVALAIPAGAGAASLSWPVRGAVLARFAYRAQTPFARGQRRGIDIAAPRGSPVLAACAGRVRFAGSVGTSGRTVSVTCGAFVVSYLHLDRIAIRRGARVEAGDALGTVGVTGRRREGRPHLTFGVRRAADRWGYVDPLGLLPREGRAPPDLAPIARRRRSAPPLGAAPASERSPAKAPAPARDVSRRASPAADGHRAGLPLGALWLPTGAVLALVAAGAPLARVRVRRRQAAIRRPRRAAIRAGPARRAA